MYERALRIFEQALGGDHPSTGNTLHQLASLYQAQGKHEQAEPLFQRVLTLRERALGVEHPDTAITLWWLAYLARQQQEYEKAEPLYRHAFSVLKRVLGLEHPDTQSIQRGYVSLLRTMGQDDKANLVEAGGDVAEEPD